MANPISKKQVKKPTAPAQEIDVEVEPGPDRVIVRSPRTLAEAIGDPVAVIPDAPPAKKPRRPVKSSARRKRAA